MKKLCIALLLLVLAGCSSEPGGKAVRAFSFTDQHGNSFGSEQLADGPWIADFMFTNCSTVCPALTAEMASLQKLIAEEQLDAQFVSFSVDPAFDSPDVLKQYIGSFTDDDSNWHLLTGYTQQEIEAFAREEFETFVLKHESNTQVVHGTNFYLLDSSRRIVGEYNFSNAQYKEQLIDDLKRIARN